MMTGVSSAVVALSALATGASLTGLTATVTVAGYEVSTLSVTV